MRPTRNGRDLREELFRKPDQAFGLQAVVIHGGESNQVGLELGHLRAKQLLVSALRICLYVLKLQIQIQDTNLMSVLEELGSKTAQPDWWSALSSRHQRRIHQQHFHEIRRSLR